MNVGKSAIIQELFILFIIYYYNSIRIMYHARNDLRPAYRPISSRRLPIELDYSIEKGIVHAPG